ncbi:ABC transporter permease subunit [Pasteurella canis]|uniref:ABC transporter permease subunit n=1 Tax=Pasteurella canis TaxID=753 RepID=UPI0038BCD41E
MPLTLLLFVVAGTIVSLIGQLDTHFFGIILTDPELYFALMMSLGTSLISLIFALMIAIPSAWIMSQVQLPFQKFIDTILDLPMVLPPLVTGLSLLLLFNSQGIVSQLIPIISQWIFSPIGIVIAQTYIASSIMLRHARSTFSALDSGYRLARSTFSALDSGYRLARSTFSALDSGYRLARSTFSALDSGYRLAAYNLGLSPLRTLINIELPMCWRPILCGAILAWSRAIGEFGATLMLAGATRFKTETLPMAVYLNIASGDFEIAVGASLWLLFISACLLFLLRTINRNI